MPVSSLHFEAAYATCSTGRLVMGEVSDPQFLTLR